MSIVQQLNGHWLNPYLYSVAVAPTGDVSWRGLGQGWLLAQLDPWRATAVTVGLRQHLPLVPRWTVAIFPLLPDGSSIYSADVPSRELSEALLAAITRWQGWFQELRQP